VSLTDEGYNLFRRVAVVHAESITRHMGPTLSIEELNALTALTERVRTGANPET
jgi:hypothetical protein